MSLYGPQFKDEQGNIVDLPINAKKLDGYTYNDYSKYYTTNSTTENAFLVTIPYVKALSDGLVIHCKFHASTTSGATLNVNNLGAKGIYYRYATAITTHIVANNYVDLIYSASIDKWVLLFSYDADSNTLGYQVRTNNALYRNGASTPCYRYQIVVETNDGLEAFTSTNNSTGTNKAQLSPNYIPNGTIRYYSGTDEVKTNVRFSATKLWQQYQGINLKYSFNISTITYNSPCFIKMTRNEDGTLSPVYSATSGGHPLVFALPTTKDGYYYTYLGRTYTSSSVVYLELELCHPTFYYDGGIRVYDGTYLYDWAKASTKPTYTASEVGALPITGGTLTGNLVGKYLTGTLLQTTLATDLGSTPTKYGVIDANGWLYTRTLDETKSDLGINSKQDKISVGTNGQLLSSNGSSLVWTNDNRGLLHHDLTTTIENTTTDKGWKMFNSTYDGFLLKSVRFNANSPSWGVGDFGSGIAFGGADTKGVVSVAYRTPDIKIAGGNGSGPVWWIGLTGTSEITYDLDRLKYTPTTGGTNGYSLKSGGGSNTPRWANEAYVQLSGSLSSGTHNNASITLVITDINHPLTKGVWRYSGTYGVFLIFAPTAITTQGSPRTAYICGYSTSISNNTSFHLVEV